MDQDVVFENHPSYDQNRNSSFYEKKQSHNHYITEYCLKKIKASKKEKIIRRFQITSNYADYEKKITSIVGLKRIKENFINGNERILFKNKIKGIIVLN